MTDIETTMELEADLLTVAAEAKLEAEADAALERIQRGQSWNDWLKVGELFCHGRRQAMYYSHSNRPEGKGYILWFSGWMERHPKLKAIDKATRNHAMQCFDNVVQITAWRTTLADNQRQTINHPTTVLRRWKKMRGDETAAKVVKKQTATETMFAQIETLEADNKRLREKIEKGGENIFALSDTAKNIAWALAGNLSVSKLTDLTKELSAELARRRKAEAEKKRAGPK